MNIHVGMSLLFEVPQMDRHVDIEIIPVCLLDMHLDLKNEI